MNPNIDDLSDEKYNTPISDAEYVEMSKFTNCDIDIATVDFRESTVMNLCDQYDIENLMLYGF
ncbi:MAG: hypothetical protein WCW84_11355 [Sulfurimonas sp.]|jgi:hypothetical protein